MCFSATASFGASAAIGVVAVASFYKATTLRSYVIACIPAFFAIQQAFEGLMWVSLCQPFYERWQGLAKNGFMIFATVVWPILLPLIAWLLEYKGIKKKILAGFCITGAGIGLYFLWCLAAYSVTPFILGEHIRYELHFPGYNKSLMTAVYIISTIIPPLISRNRSLRWFAVGLLASLCVTGYFYHYQLISVWCFFSAFLSIGAFGMIWRMERAV